MATSVGTTIQLRRDTTANWTEANPVLALAEPGLDTDKNLIKYGDGVLTWANLPYAGSGPDIGGNLNPTANGVFTLGNVTNRWQSLYATGNITGNYFIGNGSQLTGLPASYSNTDVATYLASGTDTANIITTANISGSYILGNGALLTGVITSVANINNGTSNVTVVSSDGNITVGVGGTSNVAVFAATGEYVTGVVSASGNITGGNIVTAAAVSAASVSAASVSASANITGGNILGTTAVVVPEVRNTATLTLSTSSGNLNLQPTGNIVVNSKYINGVLDPVQNQDVATKIYVDNLVTTAIAYHQAVTTATTTTLAAATGGTISYTQPNGAGNGVGALLTTTGVFNLIDTANVQTVGTRILVKNEGNAVFNGVYTWANATNIVRSTDADTYGAANPNAFSINDYFFVSSGNVNAGSAWIVDSPSGTITFGTSNIAFAQFSSSQIYTANTVAGVSLAGTVINAKVDNTTTAFDGGGNISVKASAALTTPNIGAATGTSLSTTGNITANYFSGNGTLLTGVGSVTSVATGTGLTGGPITTTGTIAIDSTVATLSGTQTLSNKRIDPRDVTTTTATSLTPDVASGDIYCYTALASALTINAPTGTPTNGDKLIFRLLDNGTARALTWDATYTAIGVTLPTTTTINKTTYVGCIYNANNTRWDVIAVTTQA